MIHPRAFQNCTSLKKITIPSSVEIIGVEAFKGCTALSEITLNGGLKIIAADAFAECEKLAKVNFYGSNEEKQSISRVHNAWTNTVYSIYDCADCLCYVL